MNSAPSASSAVYSSSARLFGHLLQHRLPLRLELRARLPLGVAIRIGDVQANGEVQLQVVESPGKIPVGPQFIGWLVIMLLGVRATDRRGEVCRLADEIAAAARVECRHSLLGKRELIRTVETAVLGRRIRLDQATLCF